MVRKRNFQIKKKLTIIYSKHIPFRRYKLLYDEKIKNCSLMEIFKNYIKFFFLNYIEKNQLNSTVL
ncbi:hypothetical protein PFTANZ_04530 [Plasmodium falciparum Tanzania (2000708)]|uniref:Uncharacterized protein n=1 Tax=Plasmodium falciparum Tanzania (2000708) TaxID=1036725 RepID=A0A024W3I7_PLAFA|nr:hypothetical protein PFTANZ_04530 [Plasmodium falciparum Tanzania (2000708)]